VIKIDYFGRYGNQLFQHFFGRILAQKYDMPIVSPIPQGLLNIYDYTLYHEKENTRYFQVNDKNMYIALAHAEPGLLEEYDGLHLHGYFQDAVIYNPYRDRIKTTCDLPEMQKNYDDIVIHLRLADYWRYKVDAIVNPDWYLKILRMEKYRKCYIVVDDHPTNKKYLQALSGIHNKVIVSGNSAKVDFHFIRSFDRIVCSNSTFCWWAAFLSEASKIYTFKPWMRKSPAAKLAGMVGAIQVDGGFWTDKQLSKMDWRNYWKK
jgi:hypothetical protein